MKKLVWIFNCMAVALALCLVSCKDVSPTSGQGMNVGEDDALGNIAGDDAGDMSTGGGHPETGRMAGKEGDIVWGGGAGNNWEPIHFDYDSASIRSEDRGTLETIAGYLKENAGAKLMVGGHCDERGTSEYNRALGQRRASSAREYLIKLGVGSKSVGTVSYGEDQPVDPGHSEDAWAKNRRAEFGLVQ